MHERMNTENDPVVAQAVRYAILLDSGGAKAADHAACAAWRASSPRHEQAWSDVLQRLQDCSAGLRSLADIVPGRSQGLQEILAQPRCTRRTVLALMLAGGASAGLAAAGLDRVTPLRGLLAGYSTATGERRTYRLADGSGLMLNARSSADMSYAGGAPKLNLLQGQALISPAAAAPFRVSTPHCEASTAGGDTGRFLVSRGTRHSLVAALEQDLIVSPASGDSWLLREGQGCRLGGSHVQMLDAAEIRARAAWRQGRLEVLDEPLSEVMRALQAYRRGILHVQAAAAPIRVQAVLPLDDTDRALDMLAQVLPVTITRYGALYVDVAARI